MGRHGAAAQWTVAKPVGSERESVWVEAGRGRWNPTSSFLFNSIQGRMEVALTADSCHWLHVCVTVCLLAPKLKPPRVALACGEKVENPSHGCLTREVTYQTLAWAESDPNPGFKKKGKKKGKSQAVWGKPLLIHTHNGQPNNTLLHLWLADTWKICFHAGPKAGQPHPQPSASKSLHSRLQGGGTWAMWGFCHPLNPPPPSTSPPFFFLNFFAPFWKHNHTLLSWEMFPA